ncbi:hypothetical protein MMC19_002277 [Ptychographa xylographoides]|nr:hypothetical protein [Ptychographa xylographoides]
MSFDINTWYRFTNALSGPKTALDVINNSLVNITAQLQLDSIGGWTGQYWHLALQPSGKYHLTTLYLGEQKLLDVINVDNATAPGLVGSLNDPGQQWELNSQNDGTYKLTNDLMGPNLFLDVCGAPSQLCFKGGDETAQHWSISSIAPIDPTSPAYLSTTSATSSTVSSTVSLPTTTLSVTTSSTIPLSSVVLQITSTPTTTEAVTVTVIPIPSSLPLSYRAQLHILQHPVELKRHLILNHGRKYIRSPGGVTVYVYEV